MKKEQWLLTAISDRNCVFVQGGRHIIHFSLTNLASRSFRAFGDHKCWSLEFESAEFAQISCHGSRKDHLPDLSLRWSVPHSRQNLLPRAHLLKGLFLVQRLHDSFCPSLETLVKQAICLVNHQPLDVVQMKAFSMLHVLYKSTGRADQNIDSGLVLRYMTRQQIQDIFRVIIVHAPAIQQSISVQPAVDQYGRRQEDQQLSEVS